MGKRKPKIELPYWQTDRCPAWCWGKHEDEVEYNDRLHSSRFTGETDLTVMDPQTHDHGAGHTPRFTYYPLEAHVYVEQHYREAEPRVKLEDPCNVFGIAMSLAEAERIARHLLRAVRLARS